MTPVNTFDNFATLWEWFRLQDSGRGGSGGTHFVIDEDDNILSDDNGDNIVYE